MIKREELTNPNSCMSRAADDEMTFVLLGRDAAAPAAIRTWVMERLRLGKNQVGDAQITEALACAYKIEGDHIRTAMEARKAPAVSCAHCGQPIVDNGTVFVHRQILPDGRTGFLTAFTQSCADGKNIAETQELAAINAAARDKAK